MGLSVSELYGGESSREKAWENSLMFKMHCSIPAIVQSYNPKAQTVEVQPAIRERVIDEDGNIGYRNYPLLINVPVAFPQAGGFSITFPINKGDECLVVFSDLAIDNWWKSGNVQNPVEIRRHDLSDGMAIFGFLNQDKLKSVDTTTRGIHIKHNSTGTGILVESGEITFTFNGKSFTATQIWNKLNE